ncbi:MAG TPA: bifunctional hydroxymethylpyrimidine kinase/phosphomethylpyrimidine kinase [Terriglobia bacterium]|nr:bifunctional hydroxymethylpyrimidine kinase/phosphomethylpyrimidine kinase [Terriglobia bacterium]
MSGINTALTVAGSDSIGGAGIQADLKTFSRLRVFGMSVITALTAQNTSGVLGILEVPPDFVARQLDAVLSDVPPDAVKTGMLKTAAVVEVVAAKVREYGLTKLVVDPVMLSKSGAPLLDPDANAAFRRLLLPLALVITPNTEEAQVLAGKPIRTTDDMEEAALTIHAAGARNVLIKGGHLDGDATDVLFDGKEFYRFRAERLSGRDSHGTGCVLSAAITAHLALGKTVREAVQLGKDFVTEAIKNGLRIGSGRGPCDPLGLGK